MKGPENTASISNSLETLAAFYSAVAIRTQRSAHSYATIIDNTFDPSGSHPTTIADGRHTLHVKYKWR